MLHSQPIGEWKAKALVEVRELKWNPKQAVIAIVEEGSLVQAHPKAQTYL